MKQFKIAIGLLVASSCSLTMLLYYWNRSSLSETMKLPSYRVTNLRTKPTMAKRATAIKVDRPLKHIALNELYPDLSSSNSSMEISDELLSSKLYNFSLLI